jgi:hypothetical protein
MGNDVDQSGGLAMNFPAVDSAANGPPLAESPAMHKTMNQDFLSCLQIAIPVNHIMEAISGQPEAYAV